MLDMKDTGTKITTRLSVVAITARPISAVAALAASKACIFFSSTNRKMFSRTTMASSMTIPTISTSASMVTLFNVNLSAHIMPNVEMTEAGIANPNGRSVDRPHHQVVECFWISNAADGAKHVLTNGASHIAAGNIRILPDDGRTHRCDWNLVSSQSRGIHPDVHRAQGAANNF